MSRIRAELRVYNDETEELIAVFPRGEFDIISGSADHYGLVDLDVEPWTGYVTVTAARENGAVVKVKAPTLNEAAAKFLTAAGTT